VASRRKEAWDRGRGKDMRKYMYKIRRKTEKRLEMDSKVR